MPQEKKQICTAEFRFQADSLDTIARNPSSGKEEPFQIIRQFCLPKWKFQEFVADLSRPAHWLNHPDSSMYAADSGQRRRCVAVTPYREWETLLVDTQGSNYARFCAYITDYRQLELACIPVTFYSDIKKAEKNSGYISKAMFYRGANTLAAYDQKSYHSHVDCFQVEKQVILSDGDYQEFIQNIAKPYPFLSSNRRSMYFEPDAQYWHCLFVTGEHAAGGILVDSEGYPHAEYSAWIPDKARLDLSGVPVESYVAGQLEAEGQNPKGQEEQKKTARENRMSEKGRGNR